MKPLVLAGLACILGIWAFGMLWMPAQSSSAVEAPRLLKPLKQQYGWQVCAIAEIGPIPGVGERQKVELCHSDGWRIMTYCLDPQMPVPEVGDFCSQTSPEVFWCGEGVQRLQYLTILETPGPQATRTRTVTPTVTPSRTPTRTQTPTALAHAEESPTPRPSATPYARPQAGGPGNLELGGAVLALIAAAGGSAWWVFRRRARRAARGG